MQDSYITIPVELLNILSVEQAWHYKIVPRRINCTTAEFFCIEETAADDVKEELELLLGKKIVLIPESPISINRTLSRYYSKTLKETKKSVLLKKGDFLDEILKTANEFGSSDIHIEISESTGRIRFRIDGRLEERYHVRSEEYPTLVNKIKISANLDIAEKRLPQDGRLLYRSSIDSHDIRVSVLPTMYGEKLVLRLLRKSGLNINLNEIGFDKYQLPVYLEGIRKPSGIILISGPTGSGKTTTLYATLSLLNRKDVNILTIEDPIEYTIDGINQVQLRDNIGLNYARALRTFLRQDPDIIMLGEIRDGETAEMAIRASLTGHLVLSTIHTNSAWGIVTRLTDMGVPAFLIAETLNTAIAQRLVRKLCPYCRQVEVLNSSAYPRLAVEIKEVSEHYLPVGCDKCRHTGYSGRIALFEVIGMDEELRGRIRTGDTDIAEWRKNGKVKTLKESALRLFADGLTSLEEVSPLILSDL